MYLSLAAAIGLAGTLLAFAATIPQLHKLVVLRSAAGVSVAALANSTISCVAWTAYGVALREVWVAAPAVVAIPATVAALALAWTRGGSRDRMWLPVAWLATILAAVGTIPWLGLMPLTVVLGCSVALLVGPAATTAWRSHDVSAIAATAWLMVIVDGVLFGLYGVLAGVTADVLYGVVAVAGSSAILLRLTLPGHLHARLVARPAPGLPAATVTPDAALARDHFDLAS